MYNIVLIIHIFLKIILIPFQHLILSIVIILLMFSKEPVNLHADTCTSLHKIHVQVCILGLQFSI